MQDGVAIQNEGTSASSGLELIGGGDLGQVALSIKSVIGLTGALFEQRASNPAIDLVDFGLKTLSHQMNMRVESRSAFSDTGAAPEFQLFNVVSGQPPERLFSISPSHCNMHVPVRLPSYTIAALPLATSLPAGSQAYVSDDPSGAGPAYSDGSNWRRSNDRSIIV